MKAQILDELVAARAAKRPVVLVTALADGSQRLVAPGSDDPLASEVAAALRSDRSDTVEVDGNSFFLRPYNPPLRLVVVGAVHIAQPLSILAKEAGYSVIVVDPRAAFAAQERFPGVTLVDEWPDDALQALEIDVRTAIVTLTHDPKLDDPALQVALRSEAFYVGALGSSRTHKSRVGRLQRSGLSEDAIARIHGPVGLSIGARSPAEIAISILAQMTQVLQTGAA